MSKHLTEKQKNIIIKLLAEGVSQNAIARQLKINQSTISSDKSLIIKSDIIKKQVYDKMENDIVEDQVKFVKDFDRIIKQGLDAITPESMAKQSASANAMVIGTLFDKKQLATGGITDDINIRDGSNLVDSLAKKYKGKLKSAKIADNDSVPGSNNGLPSKNANK